MGNKLFVLDEIDYGKRMAVERELDKTADAPPSNVLFDDSSNFIIYPTLLGIKSTVIDSSFLSFIIYNLSSRQHRHEQIATHSGQGGEHGALPRPCTLSGHHKGLCRDGLAAECGGGSDANMLRLQTPALLSVLEARTCRGRRWQYG